MTAAIGLVLLFCLAPLALAGWLSAVVLARAAVLDGEVLAERRDLAIVLSVATTLYFAVGINTVLDFAWFPVGVAAIVNRSLFILIGLIPVRWLWLYLRGRLD